ncbi:hypothetical protein BBJ28_00006692 [Nothophytophthora sp. Chile5]|nr:hypothetical protein BBJ28_00006692 [Nothophytophthora sp. Chile5]
MLALSIINIAATISAAALCLSPFPDFRRIHKQQNIGEVRILPVLMLCCNCFAWAIYGYLSESYFPVLSINVFGTLSGLAFTSVFYRWTKDRAVLNKMGAYSAVGVLLAMTFVALTQSAVIPVSSSVLKAIVGYIAVAVNIGLYAAPLQTMKVVLRTKSAASLPLTMCVVNLVNGALWVSYALLSNDMFILVPNALGVVLTAVQVALCIKYRPTSLPVQLGESLVHVKSEMSLSISPRPDVVAIDFVRSPVYEAVRSPRTA